MNELEFLERHLLKLKVDPTQSPGRNLFVLKYYSFRAGRVVSIEGHDFGGLIRQAMRSEGVEVKAA